MMKKILAVITLTALSSTAIAQLDPACDEYKQKLEELYQRLPAGEAERMKAVYARSFDLLAGKSAAEQQEECRRGVEGIKQGYTEPQPSTGTSTDRDVDPDTITHGRDPDPDTINRGRNAVDD